MDTSKINSIPIEQVADISKYRKPCKYEGVVLAIMEKNKSRLHLEINVMVDKFRNPILHEASQRPKLHMHLIQKKPHDRVIYSGFGDDWGQWKMVYETLMIIGPELVKDKFDEMRPT